MKLLRYFLPLVAVCGLTTTGAYAQSNPSDGAQAERDTQAIHQFMRAKRSVFIEDIGGNLSVSGDVRVEWQHLREKVAGSRVRGSGSGAGFAQYGSNEFDVEFNLYFDYSTECTWASAHVQFDNNMGTANCGTAKTGGDICHSGESDKVSLRRAYFGYNILEDGCSRLDIEMGRRNFYHVFDSRVQFNNRFDGVLLRYANSFECVGDFYVYAGAFIEDSVVDNYGWVIEVGFMDVMDWGLDLKYSYIDWDFGGVARNGSKASSNACHRAFESRNSQFTAAYHFNPEFICQEVVVYGAFIINHAAEKRTQTNNKKENHAWYLGVMVGRVKQCGDWSIDVNYQHVEAQAVLDCDVSGIGRGNVMGSHFADGTTAANSRGNANYQGFQVEGLYALTDNITIDVEFEYSDEENSNIGGTHDFWKWELEFIYGW